MQIAIGSDHAGHPLKEKIKAFLDTLRWKPLDFGTHGAESVDYPDYGALVAEAVSSGKAERGILVCGTGIGMSIVANKFPGVRAALCHNRFTTVASREHNDANILVLGGRVLAPEEAVELVKIWFETPFEGGRHEGRLKKISGFEGNLINMKGRRGKSSE